MSTFLLTDIINSGILGYQDFYPPWAEVLKKVNKILKEDKLKKISFFQKEKYYRVLEKDGTSRNGFENNVKKGEVTEALDWDPSPNIDSGKGLHIVKGHPFLAYQTTTINDPVYFEVETTPNPPVISSEGLVHRCQKVKILRRLNKNSPEFSNQALIYYATKHKSWRVRSAVLKKLNFKDHEKILIKVVNNGNEHWIVRRTVIRMLDPERHKDVLTELISRYQSPLFLLDIRKVALSCIHH